MILNFLGLHNQKDEIAANQDEEDEKEQVQGGKEVHF